MGLQNDFADFCSSLLHFQLIKVCTIASSKHEKAENSFCHGTFPILICKKKPDPYSSFIRAIINWVYFSLKEYSVLSSKEGHN